MREFGTVYTDSRLDESLGYIYCAFKYNDSIYYVSAEEKCTKKIDLSNNEISSIKVESICPRWIVPCGDDSFYYVDSINNTFGLVNKKKKIFEVCVPMKRPVFVCKTHKETFLVVGKGEKPILEYDSNGRLIGSFLSKKYSLQSAYYIDDTKLLICDSDLHQVIICTKDGEKLWEYGCPNYPGEKGLELSTPKHAIMFRDNIYIADGKNNRIISVNSNREIMFCYTKDNNDENLWWPTCIQLLCDKILITDGGNGRIIEYDFSCGSSIQWGKAITKKFILNNPRCIEVINDSIYIADTYNHRILELSYGFDYNVFWGGHRGDGTNELFWPRAIRSLDGHVFYICDSRNSRIIKIDENKNVRSIIYGFICNNSFYGFLDPHDIDVYANKLLITDSSLNMVVEMFEDGNSVFQYGMNRELNNPHHARKSLDGNYIISDTGNNRILVLDKNGSKLDEIYQLGNTRLNEPRWCELINEYYLIADSGNNRILIIDNNKRILKEINHFNGRTINTIRNPRCVRCVNNKLLISDTYNNRLIIEEVDNLL